MHEHDSAVADVMGSILLVGITVTMTVALSIFVSAMPGPPDETYAELNIRAFPGPDQSWGTGDEFVQVRHMYGEPLNEATTRILVAINGVQTSIEGSALGFSDGHLDIGERWQTSFVMQHNDEIGIGVVVAHGKSERLMTTSGIITGEASCTLDNDPPHAIITQNPANLEALTGTTDLAVVALIVDVCNAVDPTVIPQLEYDVGATTGIPTDMTKIGPDRYEFHITPPGGNWATVVLETLNYQILGMRDAQGNSGNSPVMSDFVDPIPPAYFYPGGVTPIVGAVAVFPNMQSASDGGATATFTEGLSGAGNSVTRFYADSVVHWGAWKSEEDAAAGTFELDDKEAKYQENLEDPIRFRLRDPPPSTDAIQQVLVRAEGNQDGHVDDGWRLQACTTVGCTVISGVRPAALLPDLALLPNPAAYFEFDVTSLRPGGGSWTWGDIQSLEVLVTPIVVFTPIPGEGGDPDGNWHLDSAWAEVTHGPGYDMNIEVNWTGVPVAGTHNLEFNYRAGSGQYRVEVYDGTSWNPRNGNLLSQTSFTKWSDPLTLQEFNLGAPVVRIISLQTDPNVQGSLHIDYARVTA